MNRPRIRKVNTKRRKLLRKELNKALAKQAAAMINHPKECCSCAAPFERNKETVRSWHVMVEEDKALLTCPACRVKLETVAEKKEVKGL